MPGDAPRRGEIFMADLDLVRGREQGGYRPFLVLSVGAMNRASAELAIGLPLTTSTWPSNLHLRIDPAESGLPLISYALPEMIRAVATERFKRRMGRVPAAKLDEASARTGVLIGLGQTKF